MPGIEPGASYMQSMRSTTELHPPLISYSTIKIANENGISVRAFNSRVYCGWDIKDAATLPILKNVPYKKRIIE